jgi:hypothetical protein
VSERSETRRVRVVWILRLSEEKNQNTLTLVLSLVRERRQNDEREHQHVIPSARCLSVILNEVSIQPLQLKRKLEVPA